MELSTVSMPSTRLPLKDPYGRPVDSLRISVTGKCNYRCIFCHGEGVQNRSSEDVFSASDYEFIAQVLSRHGVLYYKLTGGEPLLREDIHEVVACIRKHAREVSLVTNGSLLLEKVESLAKAGLDRLNVSLHSIREDIYEYITGGSRLLNKVLEGVERALKYGLRVKLNFLLLRSNVEDFPLILEFASSRQLDLNVIELEPIGIPSEVFTREHVPIGVALDLIEKASVRKYYREFQNRPVYLLPSGSKVEIVVGFQNKFLCSACTRMRLTHDGFLKTCLYVDKPAINIVSAVKQRNEHELLELFRKAVHLRKPFFT